MEHSFLSHANFTKSPVSPVSPCAEPGTRAATTTALYNDRMEKDTNEHFELCCSHGAVCICGKRNSPVTARKIDWSRKRSILRSIKLTAEPFKHTSERKVSSWLRLHRGRQTTEQAGSEPMSQRVSRVCEPVGNQSL